MAIFYVGTEDIHFIPIGAPDVWTNGGPSAPFRSEWSRCALSTFTGPGIDKRWRAPLPDISVTTGEFWFTCQLYSAIIINTKWFRFLSGDAQERLSLYGRSAGSPMLVRINDDTTATTLATGTGLWPSAAQRRKIDIYVNLSSGLFKVYSDYNLILNTTSDLTNGEYTDITGFELSGDAMFSEILWRSEDTRKLIGVRSIWPYANGHAMEWTGVKEDVDEIIVDMADANYTDTAGRIQQYKTPPLPSGLTGNIVVGGVMVGARMATGPTNEAINIRTSGSDYFSGDFDTDGGVEDHIKIWEESPDTSAPFTVDEVNDFEFNIGVKST